MFYYVSYVIERSFNSFQSTDCEKYAWKVVVDVRCALSGELTTTDKGEEGVSDVYV